MYAVTSLFHALAALMFHITLSVSMLMYGDWPVQACALFALFFAGVSQFTAQGETSHTFFTAVISAYLSALALFLGVILFIFPV